MTTERLDPMTPESKALLAAERKAGARPAAEKARVLARVEATLLGPAPGGGSDGDGGASAGPGAAAGSTARVAAAFVAGALAGGAIVFGLARPKVETVERVVYVPRESTTADVPRVAPPTASAAVPPEASAHAAASPTPSSDATSKVDSLAAERALLDPARTALGRRDAASALDATRKHEARFANGKMAEEREAIAVQALVLLGRRDEALARARRFRQRYPGSVLQAAVEAALGASGASE